MKHHSIMKSGKGQPELWERGRLVPINATEPSGIVSFSTDRYYV